jgi:hypothetical protein
MVSKKETKMRKSGFLITGLLLAGALTAGCNWTGRAVQLVSDQVDPYELQRKYELFKDEAAQLNKKAADIRVYEHRFKAFGSKEEVAAGQHQCLSIFTCQESRFEGR